MGIKKVQTLEFFVKYADNNIDESKQAIIKIIAQEAFNYLSNPYFI